MFEVRWDFCGINAIHLANVLQVNMRLMDDEISSLNKTSYGNNQLNKTTIFIKATLKNVKIIEQLASSYVRKNS